VRVRWEVTETWDFFGVVSQGFRAPNLSDFTSFELARSGELETPAPNLDPEDYVSYEIVTRAVLPAINASLYASYYFPQTYDQIVRYPTGRIVDGLTAVTKANIGDGFIQGVELGAEWRFYPEHRRRGLPLSRLGRQRTRHQRRPRRAVVLSRARAPKSIPKQDGVILSGAEASRGAQSKSRAKRDRRGQRCNPVRLTRTFRQML